MDKCCAPKEKPQTLKLKRVLWIALVLNFAMFIIEFASSFSADSQSLKADSIDFLSDSVNYVISLYVIGSSLQVRAKASMFKATAMGVLGIWVAIQIVISAISGSAPDAQIMTTLGIVGLAVNGLVTFLLFQFREGDSNMQSVWLCSRNDAIGNLAVIAAALAVGYFEVFWPDLIVAALMAYLSLAATIKIFKVAYAELQGKVVNQTHDHHQHPHVR
jgi:Co/Zn/Cd efflux system component